MGTNVNPLLSADPNNPAVGSSPATVGGPTTPGSPTVAHVQQGGAAGAPLRIAQDIMAMTQARKNNAMQQLQQNISAREAGFPVDPKAIVKLAKKAGLHFSTDEGDVQGVINMAHGQVPGPTQPNGQPQPAAGKTAASQVSSNVQQVQKGKLTRSQQQQMAAEAWANQALEAAQQRGESITRLAQLHDQVTKLKLDALSDDKAVSQTAVGKLMGINEVPFDLTHEEWNQASPEQKASMINVAAGHESDAQLQTRITNMANTMQASGRFSDPQAAMQAATALAHGQPIPADIRSQMKPFTFSELNDQASMATELIQAGVPPNKLASVMSAAAVGGLANALPTNINPLVIQQLNLQKQQVAIEAERAGVEKGQLSLEVGRFKEDALKAEAAEQHAENEEFFNNFRALVEMKKSGASIPDDLEKQYMNTLAEKSGIDVTEAKHWYQYMTGGHYYQFSPKASTDAATAGAGPQTTANTGKTQPSTFQKFYKGVKKVYNRETGNAQ